MYDKVQQTTKSRKQNKKNKNKRERDKRARSGKTCTKETTDYLQRVYRARIQIKNKYTYTPMYMYTYTHTQGMLGKARAHEGNKLTSTRNGVNSAHKMHYEFQNMCICIVRFWKNTACSNTIPFVFSSIHISIMCALFQIILSVIPCALCSYRTTPGANCDYG